MGLALWGGSPGLSGIGAVTPGTTPIVGGTDKRVLFDDNGVIGESANLTFDKTLSILTVGSAGVIQLLDGQGNGAQGNITIGVGPFSTITNSASTGFANMRIGYKAGAALTTGIGNLFIGENAGKLVTTAINCMAIGWDSQLYNTISDNNVSIGEDALKNVGASATGGTNNTAVGYVAGYSLDTGVQNSALSTNSLYNVVSGSYNIAVGYGAGYKANAGSSYNTFLGVGTYQSGTAIAVNNTTCVGYAAGYAATGTSANVFIGYAAGYNQTASNRLVIDSIYRSNEAGENASSMIVGNFHATVASQNLTFNVGYLKIKAATVAALPSAATSGAGARSFVTDALAPVWGATVAAGGAVAVPVYSDGTNWKVG